MCIKLAKNKTVILNYGLLIALLSVFMATGCSFKLGNDSFTTSKQPNQNQSVNISENINSAANQNSSTSPAKTPAQTTSKVCGNPKNPCPNSNDKEFEEYELSFQLPAKLGNKLYKSEEFYGVVFYEIDPDDMPCNEDLDGVRINLETHRKELQELYPKNKVFVHHDCGGLGYVNYVAGKKPMLKPFVGFYAGVTKAEANKFFETVDQSDGAKLVKMTVEYDNSTANQ